MKRDARKCSMCYNEGGSCRERKRTNGGQEGTSEPGGGGVSHSETETWPPLRKMKAFFN